jgi:class 3 adenylate cyclase/tetratricopeptide (TPR) repeat protein
MSGDQVTDETRQTLHPYVPLHPYVSVHAAALLAGNPEQQWVEIDGSLAFFDISGFTALTERLAALGRAGAEHINDVLNTVFTGLIDSVLAYGGDVLEFGGDAMVVLYTGDQHARRAAAGAAAAHRFIVRKGRVATPAGKVRLGMSCGMASGCQAYYLLGATRRAFVVAGPVSTTMARLEARAGPGEVLVDANLVADLPSDWHDPPGLDGSAQLRLDRVAAARVRVEPTRHSAGAADTTMLLPVQFRELTDVGSRIGELKQVAMSFIRLDGTDDVLAVGGNDEVCRRLAEISDIVDRTSSELDVCWLETQAEANSVRWTLISGAPTATERDGERLLRVLRRIADASPWPLRIGANLGVVFVGDMGHPERCTYIVMGDATNLAARLMTRAQPGEIVAGDRLVATCPGRFELTALQPFAVKGKQLPVRAASIGAAIELQAAPGAPADEAANPGMIGRERELKLMRDAIDGGQTIQIVGDAGVGKTRLWQEARRLTPERVWHITRAEPHEVGAAYLPFARLIRAVAGIEQRADEHAAGRLLGSFVARVAPDLIEWLPLLADVIGANVEPTDAVDALDPAFRADRLRLTVADLISTMTRPAAVIVVEDVHWMDEASRSVLDVLARTSAPHLAVVATRRPDGWEPPATVTIELTPLDDEVAEQLLLRELPKTQASDATLNRLRRSAAGNPLYLIELARAVVDKSGADVYPESIERLLAARIDQLPLASRALIRDASVLGTTINRALAAKVLDRDELTDPMMWERSFGDLFVIDHDSARFRHDLVRVAAYEGLSIRRRRAVHERAGDVIEAWGESVPLVDPVAALAHHASGSGIPERIVEWNQRAADAAIDKGAMEVAEWLLGEVVEAQRRVGTNRDARRATYRQLAMAAERAGHPQSALDALTRATRLAEGGERARLAVERARILEKLGRYRAALVLTARAFPLCTDDAARGHLLLARATIHNFRGDWGECLELTNTLLDDPIATAETRVRAQAHLLSEWCCTALGVPGAHEHAIAAERILIELDDSIGLANLYLNRGVTAWQECRVSDAVTDLRASSERYLRAGDVVGAAIADNNLAEILTVQFRLDQAELLLTRARRVLQAADYPNGVYGTISGLSRIVAWRGDVDEAMRMQSEALEGFRKLGAADLFADSLLRIVEIRVISGDADAALTAVEEAAAALEDLGDVPVLPATLARLRGQALVLSGRPDEARSQFERARLLAEPDGSPYEIALAQIGLGRVNEDPILIDDGMARLAELDVLAPPPGL